MTKGFTDIVILDSGKKDQNKTDTPPEGHHSKTKKRKGPEFWNAIGIKIIHNGGEDEWRKKDFEGEFRPSANVVFIEVIESSGSPPKGKVQENFNNGKKYW